MKKKAVFLGVAALLISGIIFFVINPLTNPVPQKQDGLPDNPISQTAVIAEGLDTPWALAFLPDKSILITERPGRVRLIDSGGRLQPDPLAVIDSVREAGEGGLLGIALHPNFTSNNFIYLYYTYRKDEDSTLNRVARMTYQNRQLINEQTVVDAIPGASNHNGGRIKFGPDGYLYITTGDAQNPSQAQNINSLGGKILRVTDEGKPAPNNPFNNLVYSYGHRNPQGIAWDNQGRLWETEHGPSGIWPNCCQDELNLVEKGKNYGWPDSVGDNVKSETVAPVLHSGREIWAPGGLAFINNSLYFAGLRGQTLYKVTNVETRPKEINKYLEGALGRLRGVTGGPDNMLYITTSNKDGRGTPAESDDKIIRINLQNL